MKNILEKYKSYYKENILKKHIIITIISIILLMIFFISNLYSIKSLNYSIEYTKEAFGKSFYNNLLFNGIVIFSGISPFVFLPLLGFTILYNEAISMANICILNGSKIYYVLIIFMGILKCISYSLVIATGIQYCIYSSRKYRYNQKKGYNINDFKISIYRLRKNEDKIKELQEKKSKSIEKYKKLDIKIPYRNACNLIYYFYNYNYSTTNIYKIV